MSFGTYERLLNKVRETGGSSIREYLAGDSELAASEIANPENPGWFSETDAIWRVNADPCLIIGGLASLFIQTLHPLVMAGVADHSAYEQDPLGRLQRTGRFIGATTYGTVETAETAVATVNKIHSFVTGTGPDGKEYKANDPHLLGWVHNTEVYCFWKSYEKFGGADPTVNADDYTAQVAKAGKALGYKKAPSTFAEVEQNLEMYRDECAYTEPVGPTLKFLINPGVLPLVSAPSYVLMVAAALSLLPRWSREMLKIPIPPLATPLAIQPAARQLTSVLRWFAIAPQERGGT